uniref:MADS-box domain-containing protein n=1 Tax=Salix viminalis TaxID=40686 RepID=A0A6N2NJ60_SALVM
MTRKKIQIKKLDSTTARQITISKRRKRAFQESLQTLNFMRCRDCSHEVAQMNEHEGGAMRV